jgi:hypothetical protein
MKFILIIIALYILPGAAIGFWNGILLIVGSDMIWQPLLMGTILGFIFYKFFLSRIAGLTTFEHELTHALVSLLFFRRITKFVSTRYNGGYVAHTGGTGGELGNHLIGLAPYFFPTFTILSALIRPLIPFSWFPFYDGAIGVTFSYHAFSTIEETKGSWTKEGFRSAGDGEWTLSDIGERGYIFSGLIISSLTFLFHGLICYCIIKGYAGIPVWGNLVFSKSLVVHSSIIIHGQHFIKTVMNNWG